MCSIIGYLGSSISAQDLRAGFDKTISRGPDDTRMLHIGDLTVSAAKKVWCPECVPGAIFFTCASRSVLLRTE